MKISFYLWYYYCLNMTSMIKKAAEILKKGGIVAFPTDTVYGIGALYSSKKAIEILFKIKNRPAQKPIPILISSKNKLKKVVKNIPPIAKKLIKKHWPGAITVILPKSKNIPSFVTKGMKSVGVRMPNNKIARQLIEASGGILAVTSANISGKKAATTAKEIKKLKGIDLIIDKGETKIKKASTIVAFFKNKPIVLRKGSINIP